MLEDPQSPIFCLKGQFLAFVVDREKLKYLRMAVADQEIQIKLSKQVRADIFRSIEQSALLRPLDPIQVIGKQSIDSKTGTLKLTAQQVLRADPSREESVKFKPNKSSFRILVCQNSKCQRRGGRKQHQALEETLRDRNLHTVADVEQSDCLGKCSMAPNIMLMPGKKRLSGMEPHAIADLLKNLSSKP
ncbi:(2Fe-2S) ferredoxin domain-containing protein [Cyanobacteria bacterium FACHB-63]|nr:(2Fe-2S) ferredoxin domain-containing protein [Cyanobacteria bacterium FACHB-63]